MFLAILPERIPVNLVHVMLSAIPTCTVSRICSYGCTHHLFIYVSNFWISNVVHFKFYGLTACSCHLESSWLACRIACRNRYHYLLIVTLFLCMSGQIHSSEVL